MQGFRPEGPASGGDPIASRASMSSRKSPIVRHGHLRTSMRPICNTPRRPRRRSAKNGDCPGLSGTRRPLESPSPGQSRSSRGKPRPGRNLPRQGRGTSASPRKRAAIYPEVAGGDRRVRPGSSDSVAAAAHHAPHLAPACPEPRRGGSRKPRAHSGEAENSAPAANTNVCAALELLPGPPPADGRAYVDAVSAHKNLVEVSLEILHCQDIRLKEKHLDRLLDLAYVKTLPFADEPPVIVTDLPRPDRSDREP